MADELAVRLSGKPLDGWWITDAEPSFVFDKSLAYTFAIEILFEIWALYDYKAGEANFVELTRTPPPNAVVVTAITNRGS